MALRNACQKKINIKRQMNRKEKKGIMMMAISLYLIDLDWHCIQRVINELKYHICAGNFDKIEP